MNTINITSLAPNLLEHISRYLNAKETSRLLTSYNRELDRKIKQGICKQLKTWLNNRIVENILQKQVLKIDTNNSIFSTKTQLVAKLTVNVHLSPSSGGGNR